MAVKLLTQLRHLLAKAFELRVRILVSGKLPQFLDVFFQALDFFRSISDVPLLRYWAFGFVLGFHPVTSRSTARQMIRGLRQSVPGTLSLAVRPAALPQLRPARRDPGTAGTNPDRKQIYLPGGRAIHRLAPRASMRIRRPRVWPFGEIAQARRFLQRKPGARLLNLHAHLQQQRRPRLQSLLEPRKALWKCEQFLNPGHILNCADGPARTLFGAHRDVFRQ